LWIILSVDVIKTLNFAAFKSRFGEKAGGAERKVLERRLYLIFLKENAPSGFFYKRAAYIEIAAARPKRGERFGRGLKM
jgi:hypothetical protein